MPDLETLLRDVSPRPTRTGPRSSTPGWPPVSRRPPSRWKRARWSRSASTSSRFGAVGAVASVLIVFVVLIGSSVQMGGGDDEAASGGGGCGPRDRVRRPGAGGQPGVRGLERQRREHRGARARRARRRTPGERPARCSSSASITLSATPDEVEGVADRAIRIVDALGGYVETSEVSSQRRQRERHADAARSRRRTSTRAWRRSPSSRTSRSRSQQAQDVTDQRERARGARCATPAPTARACASAWPRPRPTRSARGCAPCSTARRRRVTPRASATSTELGAEVSYATVDLSIEGDRSSGAAADPATAGPRATRSATPAACSRSIAGVLADRARRAAPDRVLIVLAALAGRLIRQRRRERALGSA